MATFLSIVQQVNTLSGTQGTVASVTSSGFHSTLAAVVSQAWLDIQNLRQDWLFLRNNVTINTTAGKTSYSIQDVLGAGAEDIIGRWRILIDPDLSLLIEQSPDSYILRDIVNLDQQKPRFYTHEQSTQTLKINPPDGIYSIDAHYFRKPQKLVDNADVPICPTEFHDAIVYRALVDLGAYLGSGDLFQSFLTRSNSLIGDLMRSQLPSKRIKTFGII